MAKMTTVPDFDQFCRDERGALDLARVKEWERALEAAREQARDQLVVYASGIAYCSVCAAQDLSREDVVRLVNVLNPCGTTRGWMISEERFASGAANPTPCNTDADKVHWLLVC